MPKFVCRGPVPAHPHVLGYFCHSNLERLEKISEMYASCRSEVQLELSVEFSRILDDVRIGRIWKRTNPARLPETIAEILSHLHPAHSHAPRVLDLGASDGSTALDLLKALRDRGATESVVVVADRWLKLTRYRAGMFVEYRTFDDQPVLLRFGRIAQRLPSSEHRFDLLSGVLCSLYKRMSRIRERFVQDGEISLLNPAVQNESCILQDEIDCMQFQEKYLDKFDVVRCSNLLNPGYFSVEEITTVIGYLQKYLRLDGLLVLSQSVAKHKEEVEQVSVWRKSVNGTLQHLNDRNGGYEARSIVSDQSSKIHTNSLL